MAEKNFFTTPSSIRVDGKLIDLSVPKVMAILNITPDSFYRPSRKSTLDEVLKQTDQFLNEGATFIDIGAYSSRPGAKNIPIEEELGRIIPVILAIKNNFPEAVLSIDTFRSRVAEESIWAGAHIINDIAAGDLDDRMFDTIAKLKVPYIFMHMQGTPQNMQQNPHYRNVLLDVMDDLSKKLARLRSLRVNDLVIDPGFGFGKSIEHNYELLDQLQEFKIFELPVLVGFSRKGMIYKALDITASESLNGTTVLNTIALQKGAKILRVHDVREAMECIKLTGLLG